ncbi:MAG: hypothetical protein D6710_09005 [Nitrospirae bacterium]|nr:MAG: hypothetical protein D6710_09005 [Nitrospirota bacterium]
MAHRVYELADRKYGERPAGAKPYVSLIPLQEVIAESKAMGVNTKGVSTLYMKLVGELGPEFYVLKEAPLEDIERVGGQELAEGIRRMRQRQVNIRPGFDGEFGKIRLFEEPERFEVKGQIALF